MIDAVDSENETAASDSKAIKETIDFKEIKRVDHILASMQRKVIFTFISLLVVPFPCNLEDPFSGLKGTIHHYIDFVLATSGSTSMTQPLEVHKQFCRRSLISLRNSSGAFLTHCTLDDTLLFSLRSPMVLSKVYMASCVLLNYTCSTCIST